MDRLGRRRVFFATLGIYLLGVLLSALSWNFWSFAVCRMLTGCGIGGEYAAVNSAIDELIPARYRGRIDLMVNGSFWLGAAAGAAASLWLLDPHALPTALGWRLGFGIGGVLGLTLMVAQAFLYNAVFFTYGLVLTHFYHVADRRVGLYLLPLTLGNLCGPLLLGALFDIIGRRIMIAGTFALSALLLLITAALFDAGALSASAQTAAWMAIFFFASAAASSAYLTVSEIFPLETRPLAIACFYALGTAIGGVLAPLLFSSFIGSGSSARVSGGYAIAGVLMLAAAGAEWKLGINAEGRSLESIATPLSSHP